MMVRVGIRDVAQAAGVSVTTVSHALNQNGASRVSEQTRRRVQDTARRMGYAPNRLASGLRNQRSQIIGFIGDEIATTPFAGRMILGAQEAAYQRDGLLMLLNTGVGRELEDRAVRTLLQHQVDGVIYARMYHQESQLPAELAGVPTVLLDTVSAQADYSSVVPDESGAAYTAVRELVEAGHTRIGYISNVDDIPATPARLEGYRRALADHGLAYDDGLVRACSTSAEEARAAAVELLDRPDRPTALFCFNDIRAMGAYQAAERLGLAVPADLSVIGIDNLELIAASLAPGLTTVALPHYEMGQWAVERLYREIEAPSGETPPHEHAQLHCPLVSRESVAAPS